MTLQPPIFIVGYMHSGTTLLLDMLRRHSSIFAAERETKVFEEIATIRHHFPDLKNDVTLHGFLEFLIPLVTKGFNVAARHSARGKGETPNWDALVEAARQQRNHVALFVLVNEHLARETGRDRWLEKTPTHIFHIETIVRHIPNARFVEVVRDCRDVLASKKTRRDTVWTDRYSPTQQPRKHLEKGFDPLWDTLSWKAAVNAGEISKRKRPGQMHTIRYEHLVADPIVTIESVCTFLQLPFEPTMLHVSTWNTADWKTKVERPNTGITTHSVARWKEILTGAELALCQVAAGAATRRLGYETYRTNWRDKLLMLPLAGRSLFEFWLRLYRKWRLAGYRRFLSMFTNYCRRLGQLLQGKN